MRYRMSISEQKEVFTIQQTINGQKLDFKAEFFNFKNSIDSWIKDFNSRVNDVEASAEAMEEFTGNVNHNYELILDLKEKMDDMKEQIQTIKLTQLIIIKKVFAEELAIDGKNKNFLKKFLDEGQDIDFKE